MALRHYRLLLCEGGCGQLADVCQNQDNEGMFDVGPPTRCHARTAMDIARDNLDENTPQPGALMFHAELKERSR